MKIKPCPFCGGKGHKRTIEVTEHSPERIVKRRMVECRNPLCFIQPGTWLYVNTTDFNVAIKKWNKRFSPKKKINNRKAVEK